MRKSLKKAIVLCGAICVAMAGAFAQNVNTDKIVAQLTKLDAAVNNEKKNSNAELWIEHAEAYYEAAALATRDLARGVPVGVVGAYTSRSTVTIGDVAYNAYQYPLVTIYTSTQNSEIQGWKVKSPMAGTDLCAVALKSLNKAYSLAPTEKERISGLLSNIERYYEKNADASSNIAMYMDAAYAYNMVSEVQSSPAYRGVKMGIYPYMAGYIYTMIGEGNPKYYALGAEALNKALAMGYTDKAGDIYFYLYTCCYYQEDSSSRTANLERAKQLLAEGLTKFPNNDNIVASFIHAYTAAGASGGSSAELIEVLDGALARNPKNADMWFARGRILSELKNYDEAAVSFKKAVEIDPNDAYAWHYIGRCYFLKGDAAHEELGANEEITLDEYDKYMQAVNDIYKEALLYLEKSFELNSNDVGTVELLKALTFHFRREPGMQEKYDKYKAIYEQLNK
ncbi:MAG: tetratricopeptide repeat protein [Alistipes sp.]|nr:tetratricopeptide repeat protein [Alistipes sp.]